ncbi:NAD(P)/FAD-dependent oxidoreductase [Paenibacillus sp. YYML68]|uniref:flavin-containing monooxygenase n=1 Tax=Paenibacillus sp. YYML68 TaxID=2909250 RepID=UPI0024906A68|nr:NAD(P)-binding domain-containing protein [Paenibacillus sp. YYML68]
MQQDERHWEVVVIGAGQAGLAAAYELKRAGVPFVCLDRQERIGQTWRERYDSLQLFTPRSFSSLPGLPLSGAPGGYPRKDELADYLQAYARAFELPVLSGTIVEKVTSCRTAAGGRFRLETSRGAMTARHIVVATGPFQQPVVPALSAELDPGVLQLHSSSYKRPQQLQPGPTVVVGAGNSGAQIAVELAQQGSDVLLSASTPIRYAPLTLLGTSVFTWLTRTGIVYASARSPLGAWLQKRPDPVFGRELRDAVRAGHIQLKGRTTSVQGRRLRFADGTEAEAANVIWATGFRSDYSWLAVPGALDETGRPRHLNGVSEVNGLFYIGLLWQRSRSSALVGGVGRDAAYVIGKLLAQRTHSV